MDAVGSAIRVDSRGREVMRVLPRINEAVNEEWISDKTRHIADGLRTQRLDRPYIRENGALRAASWTEALALVASKLKAAKPERIGAIAGDLAAVEEMYALKALISGLGSNNLDCRQDGAKLDPAFGRASYILNTGIAGIEDATSLLIIGSNPRREAPIVNARIRKRWLRGDFKVSLIGEKVDLTYASDYLGAGAETLADLVKRAGAAGERPMVLVGQGALTRGDGAAVLSLAAKAAEVLGAVKDGWNGFGVLHTAAARVGGLDLGFVPGEGGHDVAGMTRAGALDVLFLLGADEIEVPAGAFVIYQGSHGDKGAHRADVILPGAAYTEKSGTYVNTEGRVQMAARATFPPGDAKEDWAILRALSASLGKPLPFDSLSALRRELYAVHPHFAAVDTVAESDRAGLAKLAGQGGATDKAGFVPAVADFYTTNPIARASAVMAECSALASGRMRQAAE